jgi:purine-binding chemotaxis protein CheW
MLAQNDVPQTADIEFVIFSVSNQTFCLEIQQIHEIRRWSPVTVMPHSPPVVLGVMNLRGAVIPIFDLATRFGLGRTKHNDRNVVIVSSISGKAVGLLVDTVSEIKSIHSEDIKDTPDVKSDATRECIQGVISIEGEMVRVLNLKSVIDTNEKPPI